MKCVIVGCGAVGLAIARDIAAEGHDLTIIDMNRQRVDYLSDEIDAIAFEGNGAALAVQREAGVEDSDLLIASTPSDEVNVLACILAKKIGCKNTIACVHNPEYNEQLFLLRRDLGLSLTVNPDASAAREIFRLIQFPGFLKRKSFEKSRSELVTFKLDHGNPLCGCRLANLSHVLRQKVLVCAVLRNGTAFIPNGSFELNENDEITVTAPATELPKLLATLGLNCTKAKNVMIIGGSAIAVSLSELLLKSGTHVKIIESSEKRCRELSELLPDVSVLCEDGTSQPVLHSENISQMDAVVTLMDHDEENVFASMFAKMMGVPHAITKITRNEYAMICGHCDIQHIVNPKDLCANAVTQYIRAMQGSSSGSVLSLYSLLDDQVEALEFEVTEKLPNLNVPLAQLKLGNNILIANITRKGRLIFPGGSDCLEIGDIVVVIAPGERHLAELKDIFSC